MPDRVVPTIAHILKARSVAIRPGRPTIRTTYQLAADIIRPEAVSEQQLLHEVTATVLAWVQEKFPQPITAEIAALRSDRIEYHGQSLQVVSIPPECLWSLRLVQPDAPFRDRPPVPGRTWTTEIAIARYGSDLRLGVRVICASLPYGRNEITFSRPRVVLDLAGKFDLRDHRQIDGKPWRLQDSDDLFKLQELLIHWRRGLPVYLLTEPDPRRLGVSTRPFLLDEDYLARKLQGWGHVVTMPAGLGYEWTEQIGKAWSAFHGAVRTYRPGLMFEEDGPGEHPLALAPRILAFDYKGKTAEEGFTEFLIDQAFELASSKSVEWNPCLFYPDALQKEAELGRAATADQFEWKGLYEQEIAAQAKKIEEAEGLAASFAEDSESYRKQLEAEQADNGRLRVYIETLRQQVESKTGRSADATITFPDSFDGLGDWVTRYLAGRVLLHPRSERGLKDAIYENPQLVYRSLMALASEYRDMRLGVEGAKDSWEKKIGELGLRIDRSITATRAGEEGDEYYVRYPIGTQKRHLLEWHLCKGSTKDDRVCLRIYFFWDSDRERVVVGWLPSHLDTRTT